MLNYDEIVTQANDHRTWRLADAEQRRLARSLAPAQAKRGCGWAGQRLIGWSRQLWGEKGTPVFPVNRVAVVR